MKRTLRDVALELLAAYESSERAVIWEYSGSIEDDEEKLENMVKAYREEIKRLSNG